MSYRYLYLGLLLALCLVSFSASSFKSPDTNPHAIFLFETDIDVPYLHDDTDINITTNDRVVVVGNADIRGGDVYNMALALRRASNVAAMLPPGTTVEVISAGDTKPMVVCESLDSGCLQPNRRVSVLRTCGLANFPCTSGRDESWARDLEEQQEVIVLQQGFRF